MSLASKIPNALSLSRLVLLPIILALLPGYPLAALVLTSIAFFTDYLDGALARRLGATSPLGAMLDPMADKILTIALMGFFVYQGRLSSNYFLISTTRDVSQLIVIPILMFWKKIPFKVAPNLLSKISAIIKYGIIFLLLLQPFPRLESVCSWGLMLLILPSAVMELFILINHFQRLRQILQGTHDTFE